VLVADRLWPLKIVSCALFLTGALALAQTATTTKKPVQEAASAPASTKKPTGSAAHRSSTRRRRSRKTSVSSKKRGQQAIDPKRAEEIQEALIREHYLTGEPAGAWNDAAQKAMQRYQADHGWQSKQVPDSRALIKLGLGPDHEHLLNPESAMTSQPEVRRPPAPAHTSTVPPGPETQQR
jgi:hypothetical protein